MEAREERHEAAEEDRLLYVAATRARDLLVVSRYPHSDRQGPWTKLDPALEDMPALEMPAAPGDGGRSGAEGEGAPDAPERAAEGRRPLVPDPGAIADRWAEVRRASYRLEQPSQLAEEPGRGDRGEAGAEPGPGRNGEGRSFGAAVHGYLQRLLEGRVETPEAEAARLLEAAGADPERASEVVAAGHRLEGSELGRRIGRADRVMAEVPLARWRANARPPTLVRGTVDLAFREEPGWVLVDHKTHRAPDETTRRTLTERFRPQLDAYADAWSSATGERVAARGIWFTGPGVWHRLEDPGGTGGSPGGE
jgi:ATP-dependent helicase/nuclease subunit A